LLKDKDSDVACDQSALVFVYLLDNTGERLGKKTTIDGDGVLLPELLPSAYWKDGMPARY